MKAMLTSALKADDEKGLAKDFYYFAFSTVVTQDYVVYTSPSHVIRGNDVLIKCDIPSFVVDFASIVSWVDNAGGVFTPGSTLGNLG